MMGKAEIAYVMPTVDHPEVLGAAVDSIAREIAELPVGVARLLVVDNGTTDPEACRFLYSKEVGALKGFAVLNLRKNVGVSVALNKGFHWALKMWEPDFLIRCDNDIVVEPEATMEVVEMAKEHHAIVGPLSNRGMICQNRPSKRDGSPRDPNALQPGRAEVVSAVAGFFCCYPRDIYENTVFEYEGYRCEGFPEEDMHGERIMRYAEDSIHQWMAAIQGYQTMMALGAWVRHIHTGSGDIGDVWEDMRRAKRFSKEFNAARRVVEGA